ncbi:MAG TPA: hypothetical protein VEP67_05375 [Thiobacillaceae bacterium]|nr:hypothetical protein [Thiobacillaceae bacterium]
MYDTLRTLAGQLLAVPGAPDRLLSEYFSKAVRHALPSSVGEHAVEVWRLADASVLSLLNPPEGLTLGLCQAGVPAHSLLLPLPAEVLSAASLSGDHPEGPYRVSPMLLALTAVAAGYVDGDRLLRSAAPDLLRSAQELLLITACRLCG